MENEKVQKVKFSVRPVLNAPLKKINVIAGASATVSLPTTAASHPNSAQTELDASQKFDETIISQMKGWTNSIGLIIQISNETLDDGRYHGCLAVVKRILADGYGCEVQVVSETSDDYVHSDDKKMVVGDVLQLDQEDCKPVLPREGSSGIIVAYNGPLAYGTQVKMIVKYSQLEIEVEVKKADLKTRRLIIPTSSLCRHISVDPDS